MELGKKLNAAMIVGFRLTIIGRVAVFCPGCRILVSRTRELVKVVDIDPRLWWYNVYIIRDHYSHLQNYIKNTFFLIECCTDILVTPG